MNNEDVMIQHLTYAEDMIIKFSNQEEAEGKNQYGNWMVVYARIFEAITVLKNMRAEEEE